jgi:ketosteroid isomerase-like protein
MERKMKKLLLILPLVFLLCFTFSCQQGKELAVDIEAEREAVREAFLAQGKAGPAKDIELFMSYFAEDAFVANLGDKDAIREWYTNWFSKGNYWDNGTIEKIEVSASGDMAYTVCSWDMFNEKGSRGKNSNTIVWKKQADGSWKVVSS